LRRLSVVPFMIEVMLPVLFAVFIWWFSTGLVLVLDGLPKQTFRWSILISSLLAAGAFAGLAHTAGQSSTMGAYCSFSCALLVWGWHELTFLTGWLTGPRKQPSPPDSDGWARFFQAVGAIVWHELAILASGLLIIALTWGAPNQVGAWTFSVLWVMRTSAKLNLFLGVRNLSEEFLPAHLAYMESFFRRRAMNLLFPFSLVGACAVLALVVMRAVEPGLPEGQVVGWMLVASLLFLAIVEHLLLVLPLPSTALWRWALRQRASTSPQPAAAKAPTNEDLVHVP
jgi:putative photosynthetic complex assembly protein 2